MTTRDTLTADQIARLRTEAGQAGDLEMVRICDAAIRGNQRALGLVLAAIRDAEAQQ